MALSQRSVQTETKKPPTAKSTFSLTDKWDKVISSFKSITKTAPGHKGKESTRSISLFPDVFVTKANTEDSPTRLPASNWEGFFSSDSDNRIVMPYLQLNKEKRMYHAPFIWSFDEALAKHVASQSLVVIKEASAAPENQSYQIQPNREKIEKLREKIDVAFGMYYKMVFYHKIRINCSLEINQLRLSLQNINIKIDAERIVDYENATQELFTSMNIHERVYEDFKHILETPIKENFIPTLMRLKKEFYAMEYLSGQHKDLEKCLDTLTDNVNKTIGVIYVLKKQLDVEKKLSISPADIAKFEKVQNPQDLYNAFVDLTVQIKALSNEANQFEKLRKMYRKYLKLAVILEVYARSEAKLKDLKKRLFVINNRLQKKVESQQNKDFYDLFRRATSDMQAVELPAEEFNVDLMGLIDGEDKCLEKPMIAEMKHQVLTVEAFVRRAELFCEELAANKNPKKANKMQENSGIYIQQVEKVLRAIAHAKKIMDEIKPIVESEFIEQEPLENIEKEVRSATKEIAYQVKHGVSALDLESWSSSKVLAAVNTVVQQESILKRSQKGNQKGIAFGRKRILKKLAHIIRGRTNEKNRVYLTCRSRVESSLSIGDSLSFFKSKRLWQAISSPKSHMVSIQSKNPDGKLMHRKIYCNPELESYILRCLRVFVNALAEMPQKHLP